MLNGKFLALIIILICTIIVGVIVCFIRLYKPKNKEIEEVEEEIEEEETVVVNTELPENFDIEEFEYEVKELYIKLQNYFSELDYDSLKDILDSDIYNKYETQMKHLEKCNKRSIRENIEYIDFKINDYENNSVKVSIGVLEDKYTKYLDNDNYKPMSYENYYELIIVSRDNKYIISSLNLLYSHSKKR